MRTKSIILGIIAVFVLTASAQAQRVWTLEQCIDTALANNRNMKLQRLTYDSRNIAYQQSRYAQLPNLNASVGQNFNFGRSLAIDNTYQNSNSQITNFSISSGLNLFSGFRVKNTIDARRAELLAELMRFQTGIAVAGTHGKTTTTSLIALVMSCAELDPTVIIGGNARNIGANARVGAGSYLVAEADESDASFLHLTPEIAVVTNIEEDHLDHYRDIGEIIGTFRNFLDRVPFFGTAVVCGDDSNIRSLIRTYRRRVLKYGLGKNNDLVGVPVSASDDHQTFEVYLQSKSLGLFTLPAPGKHMLLNSLAAIGVGLQLMISPECIKQALASYQGVRRRMELKGSEKGVLIIDDYAHHPTEIKATLETLKNWQNKPIIAVFEPHRFSRTKFFLDDFVDAFEGVDMLVILPVYAASEQEHQGISSDLLVERCRERYGKRVFAATDFENAVQLLKQNVQPNSVVITLGAGNVTKVGDMFLDGI